MSFRQADCPRHGACATGVGVGERLFTVTKRNQIEVYSWGKEGFDQKLPLPEQLKCLTVLHHPVPDIESPVSKPQYRVPWLLAGGSASGRIYIWELASGNLLCVKDAHYQPVSVLQFSSRGEYLVSAGDDGRVLIWRTQELINSYGVGDDLRSVKPYQSITDHTMPVTDILIGKGLSPDQRLYTGSRDGTLRIYDLSSRKLLTTLVLPSPVESFAVDPAGRSIYVGLESGIIRTVPLYHIDPHTSVLEAIGGNGKIITIEDDFNLTSSFVQHQQEAEAAVTALSISMDGMNIVSGDTRGRVFVSDVVTRQVVKAFPAANSPISVISVFPIPSKEKQLVLDKKHRLIPQLKRIMVSENPLEHSLHMEIPSKPQTEPSFDTWIETVANDEVSFKQMGAVSSTVRQSVATQPSTQSEELAKITTAYSELKQKHEQLLEKYTEMLE
ncbi:hypothetical protein DIURU_001691 [Diutina rugosa]|uniref:Pre-rRNA-processing protein IPI3 n=1 Tax=Diutina rugosa TaxID=5481 RepID=A0A642UTU1_DIURU|nr:uncharacterized protein DIURU_001691 [Diutina rugosa]KAA8905263.1 hypothetical protein DIURU_001691 [Diutina rugosa]